MYQLYYYPGNASIAVHIVLEALGQRENIDYELTLVDRSCNGQKSDEYLKLNPAGRIPTLVDKNCELQGGELEPLVIFESVAICQYLLDRHPDSNLTPPLDSVLRSQFYQWLNYLSNSVQAEIMMYFYPERYSIEKNAAKGISVMAQHRVTEMFLLIDSQLENQKYLVGEQLTLCDIFLFMVANWASEFEQPPLSMKNLSVYLKGIVKEPAIGNTYIKEGKGISQYLV